MKKKTQINNQSVLLCNIEYIIREEHEHGEKSRK